MIANTATSPGPSSPSHSCQPTKPSAAIGASVTIPVITRSRISLWIGWTSSGPGWTSSGPGRSSVRARWRRDRGSCAAQPTSATRRLAIDMWPDRAGHADGARMMRNGARRISGGYSAKRPDDARPARKPEAAAPRARARAARAPVHRPLLGRLRARRNEPRRADFSTPARRRRSPICCARRGSSVSAARMQQASWRSTTSIA